MTKIPSISKLLIALPLLLPIQLHAAGPYDGIYHIDYGINTYYISVQENSETNQMVVMIVNATPSNNSWHAMIGIRSGGTVPVSSITGISDTDVVIDAEVVFNDDKNATVKIYSCVDGFNYECNFPSGATMDMNKIF